MWSIERFYILIPSIRSVKDGIGKQIGLSESEGRLFLIVKLTWALAITRDKAVGTLEKIGFIPYLEPDGGMFIWARLGDMADATEMAGMAAKKGILLAPGNLFSPKQEPSPWLRFNVASFDDSSTIDFLSEFVGTRSESQRD